LFEEGFGGVHADPHPGNLLLQRTPLASLLGLGNVRIGLVDWGQVKRFDLQMRLRLAQMVEALCAAGNDAGRASSDQVLAAFRDMGVNWNSSKPLQEQRAAVAAVATEWFDTVPMPHPYSPDPTSSNYPVLVLGELTEFPTELLYFFRATQYLRAMGDTLGLHWSLAELWRPHARRLLRHHGYRLDCETSLDLSGPELLKANA
jgi:predicted unusual protein kinase regulating ubiquinone biosynthesis (AarF/ABC1/UbiB family)